MAKLLKKQGGAKGAKVNTFLHMPKALENDTAKQAEWVVKTAKVACRSKGLPVGDIGASKLVHLPGGAPLFIRKDTTPDDIALRIAVMPVVFV